MGYASRTDEEPEPLDGGHDGDAAHVGAEDVDDCNRGHESRRPSHRLVNFSAAANEGRH